MPRRSKRHEAEHDYEGRQTDGQRQAHVRAGREHFAADQAAARDRQAQQCFEGAALALAGGRVDGQVQAAHEQGKQARNRS